MQSLKHPGLDNHGMVTVHVVSTANVATEVGRLCEVNS